MSQHTTRQPQSASRAGTRQPLSVAKLSVALMMGVATLTGCTPLPPRRALQSIEVSAPAATTATVLGLALQQALATALPNDLPPGEALVERHGDGFRCRLRRDTDRRVYLTGDHTLRWIVPPDGDGAGVATSRRIPSGHPGAVILEFDVRHLSSDACRVDVRQLDRHSTPGGLDGPLGPVLADLDLPALLEFATAAHQALTPDAEPIVARRAADRALALAAATRVVTLQPLCARIAARAVGLALREHEVHAAQALLRTAYTAGVADRTIWTLGADPAFAPHDRRWALHGLARTARDPFVVLAATRAAESDIPTAITASTRARRAEHPVTELARQLRALDPADGHAVLAAAQAALEADAAATARRLLQSCHASAWRDDPEAARDLEKAVTARLGEPPSSAPTRPLDATTHTDRPAGAPPR